MNKFYQQGEVILEQIDKIPTGLKKLKTTVLVRGVSTSNEHKVVGAGTIKQSKEKELFLEVTGKCSIKHPEHKPIPLPKGCYKIVIVREYDHFAEEARKVED